MHRLRSECPLCGGVELPTGNLQVQADGREYAEFLCHDCGSTGWEWAQGREPVVLMQGIIAWVFMVGGFIGGTSLVFAAVLGFMAFDDRASLGKALIFLLVGCIVIAFGARPRVVERHPVTGDVKIMWGKHFPLVYEHLPKRAWVAFDIHKRFPVVVTPAGSSVRASSLPPYYQLSGATKHRKNIQLYRSTKLEDVKGWAEVFAEVSGVACTHDY